MTTLKYLEKFETFENKPSENLNYHLEKKIPVLYNVFRPGSSAYYELLKEAKIFKNLLIETDREIFENTDIGEFGIYNGVVVPLDLPMEADYDEFYVTNEAEYQGRKVNLNKPMRSSGPKKYKVYVRNPKTGKVVKVNFGDVKGGLTTKSSSKKARSSFAKRHKCAEKVGKPGAKLTPGYWSCVLPRYGLVAKQSGYW